MSGTLNSLGQRVLVALGDGAEADAYRVVRELEDEASAALAGGELAAIVSARGRIARLRRAVTAVAADWSGVERMLVLDRALGSAVTGLQLALRRELRVA
jgi:hypothetical protein